jgi:glutathione synthase/RimK-type ligase-like ATP-grasp enzyme
MLLIVTNSADYHTDIILQTILKNKLGDYFRLNTDLFHIDYDISVYPDEKKFVLTNKKNGKIAHSDEISSAWWRRPEKINVSLGNLPEKLHKFLIDEYRILLRSVIHLLDYKGIKIVTYPSQLNRAKDKTLQQIWAKNVGFLTPKQLLTSSNNDFKTTFSDTEKVVSKSIDSIASITDSKKDYVLFANVLNTEQRELIANDSMNINISYFQEKINRKYELRVIAYDNKSFIFKIDVTGYSVDWRRLDPETINYILIDSEIIHDKCIGFLKKANLKYGAFDLIVDEDDNVYFIECNPNGQFLFCDIDLKTNMVNDFVNYLIR